jgi:hypothetical protein
MRKKNIGLKASWPAATAEGTPQPRVKIGCAAQESSSKKKRPVSLPAHSLRYV